MRSPEAGFLVAIAALALVFFPFGASPFALKQEFALFLFGAALLYWVNAKLCAYSRWK